MFRNIVVFILVSIGIAGWSAAKAQSPVSGCDWVTGAPTCAGGGTLSTAGFMVAHRMERHSLVTSDGAIHLIINTGQGPAPTGPGALVMYTSLDNGNSWNPKTLNYGGSNILAYTTGTNPSNGNLNSTSDVATLPPSASGSQDSITLVFNDNNASTVEEAQLTWHPTLHYWKVTAFYQILPPISGTTYAMASYLGANGIGPGEGEYLAVMATTATNSQIEVFYNNNQTGSAYAQMMLNATTYLSVPNPANLSNSLSFPDAIQHAPHLVYLPTTTTNCQPTGSSCQSLGLLYETEDDSSYNYVHLYWEVITATATGGSPSYWAVSPLGTVSLMSQNQKYDYNSGFSVATVITPYSTDAAGTQYVALLAQTQLTEDGGGGVPFIETAVFNPSISSAGEWDNYEALTSTTSAATPAPSYVKLTYSAQNIATQPPYVYVFFDNGQNGGPAGPYTLNLNGWAGTTPFAFCRTGCTSDYISTYTLTTPAEDSTTSYSDPRLEAPEYLTTDSVDIPVWLQYIPSTSSEFSLFSWEVMP